MTCRLSTSPLHRRTIIAGGSAGLLSAISGCAARDYIPGSVPLESSPTITITPTVADVVRRSPTGDIDTLTLAEMGFTLTFNWDNISDTPYPLRPDLSLDGRISAPESATTEFETLTQITPSTFQHKVTTTSGTQEFDIQTVADDKISLLANHSQLTADTFAPASQEYRRKRTVEFRLTGDIGGSKVQFDEIRTTAEVTVERDSTTLSATP